MECPGAHEWYELERGAASREDVERLRRHLAECDACRDRAEADRDLAAALEVLANRSRADLSPRAVESLFRRARVHGLLGRPMRRPVGARPGAGRWIRWAVPAAALAAAAALIVFFNLQPPAVHDAARPAGALARLVRRAADAQGAGGLVRLAALARAAVGEELARPDPKVEHVADLLLVAHIAARPHEDRQVRDVRFLVEGVWADRKLAGRTLAVRGSGGFALASVALAAAPAMPAADPLSVARRLVLEGRHEEALASAPPGADAAALRVWCLEAMGRSDQAAQLLTEMEAGPDGAMARALDMDLALQGDDVVEAIRRCEELAAGRDRYWFAAGYLVRYEQGDPRGAGLRFRRLKDPRFVAYVAREFAAELNWAEHRPVPLMAEDFEGYDLGTPSQWALVRARGGEFHIVETAGGRALEQDEVDLAGAELLTGSPRWGDYTFQVDVQVVRTSGDYRIGASACRGPDDSGYVLELSSRRLRLLKQFAAAEASRGAGPARHERLALEPMQAAVILDEPPAVGWWYTMKIRVQRMDGGVSVAGKVWRRDTEEPLAWQVAWTDTGQAGGPPLVGGLAGVQINGARVLVDNLMVFKDETP